MTYLQHLIYTVLRKHLNCAESTMAKLMLYFYDLKE